jgi:acylphosphatase
MSGPGRGGRVPEEGGAPGEEGAGKAGPGDPARIHAVVTGIVQGVCFRAETRYEAERLGVTGWVRNRADGSVELVAEGLRASVEALIAWCRHGPEYASVEDVEVRWEAHKGEFSRFGISR